MTCTLTRDDDGIFELNLGDADNRFNETTVREINAHFDTIEEAVAADGGPAALVTVADNKIWHNGLDLDWMAGVENVWAFISTVDALMARVLRLPVPTIAAVGGHAFAAGAMFALSHDVRVMRSDRGFFCLPEVNLGMAFGAGFAALNAAKIPTAALTRLAVHGERLEAEAASQLGVVDAVAADPVATRDDAFARARKLASIAGPTVAAIRLEYYGDVIAALEAGRPGAVAS